MIHFYFSILISLKLSKSSSPSICSCLDSYIFAVIKFGSSGLLIQDTLSSHGLAIPCLQAKDLKGAVSLAKNMAKPGRIMHPKLIQELPNIVNSNGNPLSFTTKGFKEYLSSLYMKMNEAWIWFPQFCYILTTTASMKLLILF